MFLHRAENAADIFLIKNAPMRLEGPELLASGGLPGTFSQAYPQQL
ncbi:MAG TPA: hypothetical protein VF265_03185 [Nevskiaceae bacterium]